MEVRKVLDLQTITSIKRESCWPKHGRFEISARHTHKERAAFTVRGNVGKQMERRRSRRHLSIRGTTPETRSQTTETQTFRSVGRKEVYFGSRLLYSDKYRGAACVRCTIALPRNLSPFFLHELPTPTSRAPNAAGFHRPIVSVSKLRSAGASGIRCLRIVQR